MQFFEGIKLRNTLFEWREHTRANRNVKGGVGVDMHIQPSVEIIFVTDGKIDIQVGGTTTTANTNDATLIFPFQPHGYKKYGGSEFIRFAFDPSLASDFFGYNSNKVGETAVFKTSPNTQFLLRNNFVGNKSVDQFTVQSFLYSILSDFTSQVNIVEKTEDDSILIKAIDYVKKHKEDDLKMNTVAKALGYSGSHFSFAINKTAGFGFNTLLAMIRVDHAKQLLRQSEKTILEIILECGFGSERSFYRQFKEMTGESPLKYKNSTNTSHTFTPQKSKFI